MSKPIKSAPTSGKGGGTGPAASEDPTAVAGRAVLRSLKAKHDRAIARAPKVPVFRRGLYGVAQLACALNELGYLHDGAEYEAALEEDNSPVPAMLGEALAKLGEVLIAMTEEEVHELLDDEDEDEEIAVEVRALTAEQRDFVAAGATPRARAWRAGIAVARAGKTLSKSNEEKLEEAQGHQERAMKHHRALGDHQEAVGEHIETAQEHHERATKTLQQIGECLRAIQDPESPELGTESLDEAVKYHRAATGHLEKLGTEHTNMADRNEDVGDSHRAMGRCVKSAQRCVRSVVDGAATTEPDSKGADELEDDESAKEEKARRRRLAKAIQLRGTVAA